MLTASITLPNIMLLEILNAIQTPNPTVLSFLYRKEQLIKLTLWIKCYAGKSKPICQITSD